MIKTLHKIYPNKKLKVAAYARVSNDKEELQTSLNEQIIHYTNMIMENPEWEFAGIYPDLGISGTTLLKRKEFMKMIENAKLGLIDIILVKSISRFSRNLIDFLTSTDSYIRTGNDNSYPPDDWNDYEDESEVTF